MGERIDKAKGKIKQAVANLTGDEKLKHEGQLDELRGQAKGVVEDVKSIVKETVKDAKTAAADD